MRYFTVDSEKGGFLNGQSYPLRGFNRHEDVDGKGSALTAEDHESDMQLISETGATFIRLSHYPQSSCFYDLADRQGMVLWSEIPLEVCEAFGFPVPDNCKARKVKAKRPGRPPKPKVIAEEG